MDRSIALLIIGLIFGVGLGFAFGSVGNFSYDGHHHGEAQAHASAPKGEIDHDHDAMLSLPAGHNAPTLKVDAKADPLSGWNLHIQTTGFRFSPENASLDHVDGEGHAHIYVNGEKLGRFYGPWVHLGSLPSGPVEIEVTLNANDHRLLAVADRPLSTKLILPR